MVVYKRGKTRPRKTSDLLDKRLAVIAGSSYESQLEKIRESLPDLEWHAEKVMGMESLLLAIADISCILSVIDLSPPRRSINSVPVLITLA